MQRVILIWAVLIGAYLVLTNWVGTSTALSGFTSFVTGTTKTLQGRG